MHDNITSWSCGMNVKYDLCYDYPDMDCWNGHGEHGAGTHTNYFMGGNDKLDTLRLQYYDSAKRGAVMLFSNYDCHEISAYFISNTDPHQDQEYTRADMQYLGMPNDVVSSVMVPYGYSVILYSDDARGG